VKKPIPMIGISAFSGTGKTTLLKQIIPLLKARDLRIAVLKHAHHEFEVDIPGKDSYELRKSGADQTIISTATRMADIREFKRPEDELSLDQIVASLDADKIDLILVEGYKSARFSKIELNREALGHPFLHTDDPMIIALACDHPQPPTTEIPILDLNNIDMIADFIYQDFYLANTPGI
jgi:molybdopterin-guanine dinucleotide biosynthesis protein MobB